MSNPFEQINQKLDEISTRLSHLEQIKQQAPTRISFPEFAKQHGISRQTIYNQAARGMFQTEKIGGRNFVVVDSIKAIQ